MAVIGVGYLGQHHARLLAAMPDVDLIGVVDADADRAAAIAARVGAPAWTDAGKVLGQVDAVTIAVPTTAHVDVALAFVSRGVPVLVEKPIASSVAEADRLLRAAAERGACVATGHTERFNPAVAAAWPLVAEAQFVEVHRIGTFPERSLDIDVIFDLMIHDLDLLLARIASPVVSVDAVGVDVLTPRTDIANARLRFASGCIANLTASRISRERIRKARFFQRQSYVSIDFAAQELEVFRLRAGDGRPEIEGGRVAVTQEEPLARELRDFVDAVRGRRPPLVTGEAGRDALRLAEAIAAAIHEQRGSDPAAAAVGPDVS